MRPSPNQIVAPLLWIFCSTVLPVEARPPKIPDDVQENAESRVQNGYTAGIVIGIVSGKGTNYFSVGKPSFDTDIALNQDSVFEIGSITKVFTAVLLADMALKGEVSLDDPVQMYLPKDVRVPEKDGKQISFFNLSTQFSGLPRLPDNMSPADLTNPYADYTVKQLYEFLSRYELTRDIGQSYEYSNLGVALLGHVLSLRAGKTYEALIRERIAGPLRMRDTGITLNTEMSKRLAKGHILDKEVANWDLPTLAGAGALRSSAQDMIRFLAANMGISKSPLRKAMNLTHEPQFATGMPDMKIGLGWHIRTRGDQEIIWHNGGTGGYHSFIGFIKKDKIGVVVLTNSIEEIDDLGFHFLDPSFPLKKIRVAVDVKQETLLKYEGKYVMNPNLVVDFQVRNDKLTAQPTGQQRFPLLAISDYEFFLPSPEATITFELTSEGIPEAVIINQGGSRLRGPKVEDDYKGPPPRAEISVDPKLLEPYVGRYQLAPGVLFDVKLDDGQLQIKLTGQPFYPIFPESKTKFFYKVVYAQITFVKDKNSIVTGLILHQNGIDQPAEKIK